MSECSQPIGWASAPLGQLSRKIVDGSHTPPPAQSTGKPMLSGRNVINGAIEFSEYRFISPEAFELEHRRTDVQPGNVLLTIVGSIGRSAVVPVGLPPFTLQRSVAVLKPEGLLPKFLMYQLQSPAVQGRFEDLARGTAQKGVYLKTLAELQLRVAPIEEQKRLVAQLEALFTDLDAAVAAVERVQANLKRYRASVLKAACEGRLVPTEAKLARKEGRSYETGEQLLKRVLEERRAKWEADQLAKMLAARKPPKNDDWKKKYKEPEPPEIGSLPELPEGWTWAKIDMIADTVGGITKGQKRRPSDVIRGVPYLRVANVQRGYLDLSEMKDILATEKEIQELCLQPNDILFNEGGDRDKLGRGWVWEGQITECIHQNHVYRARLFTSGLEPQFISYFANSEGQRYFMDEGKQTTNLASISLTKLRAFPVPLPPSAEQSRIILELRRQLDYADAVSSACEISLRRSERLRQSILMRAFEGKLVSQDPNDEPASVLLERIRSDRESRQKTKSAKQKPRKKAEAVHA